MKKIILFYFLFFSLPFGKGWGWASFAQTCDTLAYSDGVNFFPDSADASAFTVSLIDNDSLPVNPALASSGINSEWQIYSEVISPGDTNYYLGATSWFASPGQADNWIIFGGVTIPSAGAMLQWQHKFADNGYRDGYEVLINTVGNTMNDFNTNGTVLFSVTDNDASTDGDTLWSSRSVNLSGGTYGGQKVYIAFHHNAFDMFFLFLDNILIKSCSGSCPAITMASTLTNPLSCTSANGSIALTPSGGTSPYSYMWGNGQTSATATGLGAGTFNVTVTDANGCTGDSLFSLTSPSGLTVTTTSADETAPGANNGTATATASGGNSPYSYNWSNGKFTTTITGLAPGTYTVTVTDAAGCTATATATVNAYVCTTTASATSTDETAPNANDGSASATASGGNSPYSYNWSNGSTTLTASGLAAGNYTVTVTDAIGCTATATVTVDSFMCTLTASATSTGETSIGAGDGTASVTTTNGVPSYSYIWSNGGTSATLSALSAGTYFVTVTDGNNCTATTSATVSPASLCNMAITNISVTNPSCSGGGDGQAAVTISGGAGNILFSWSNGNTGSTAFNLDAGTFTVTATDMNNCTADTMVIVSQPSPLSGTVAATGETCAGCSDGTANATVTGGTIPYSYNWTSGQNSPNIDSLAPGIYSVIVIDANGCMFTGTDTVLPAVLDVNEMQDAGYKVQVYPNPNNGEFTICNPEKSGQVLQSIIYNIEIYNSIGERVFQTLNIKNQTTNIKLNLPVGIYFVKIKSVAEIEIQKIIIR